ncbi:CehA/McbA family metallohydrolase [Gorillibacterium sp. sgz5001074]|uniref:CehA/McbA family metallohydrolase n=1 Tax=Gorillibacterium sp. sgz5001074 TaxID=3446695 RepID=UPI003F66208F
MLLRMTRDIRPDEQGFYLEVPFQVPEGVASIAVRYEVEGENSVMDLGIRDMDKVRGWSGGARKSFELGREQATPGYRAGFIPAGEWAVLLGAYKVGVEGCRVQLSVELRMEEARWLCGELHAHTDHSDGAFSLEEAIRLAKSAGLDFLALTDHNTVSQNLSRPRSDAGLVLIPAMELTTNAGHCNLYGVEEPVDDFRAVTPEQLAERIRSAKERGAYVSLNHPHCGSCGWHWGFGVSHDWVEIWNGPWREDNRRTLEWWQRELAGGRKLPAVGGSDFHREHPHIRHGMPCSWVRAMSRSAAGILEAVNRGHVTVSYAPDGPRLELTAGEYLLGDTVPAEQADGLTLMLQADKGLKPGDRIRLLSDRGTEAEWEADGGPGGFRAAIPMESRLFYRAELWRRWEGMGEEELLAAVTNPIYIR